MELCKIAKRRGLKTAKLPKLTVTTIKKTEKRQITKSEKLLNSLFKEKSSKKKRVKNDIEKSNKKKTLLSDISSDDLPLDELSNVAAPSTELTQTSDSTPGSFLSSIQAIFAATDIE